MSAWAKPGAKVVCVDAGCFPAAAPAIPSHIDLIPDEMPLVVGAVYTIRDIYYDEDYSEILIRLVEVVRDMIEEQIETGWHPSRFRPLVSHSLEQDVAKFRHLLAPSPIDAGLVPAGVELVE